jgi:xanthine dehydrogenase YagR molybdenum-binding subunit
MRAPGKAPGSFALESALDELAAELRIDPIELRIRNEPAAGPDTGRPFSSRHLTECLREGARRFGWASRDPAPRARQAGGWWTGTGVAAATYPHPSFPPSSARVRALAGGRYQVEIAAADIGTGALTILTQIAAGALGVAMNQVELVLGSSSLPWAMVAGASGGTSAWSEAILAAVTAFRAAHGAQLPPASKPPPPRHPTPTRDGLPCTPSGRNSPRSASTPTPARSASPACWESSTPGRSSTRARPGPS